MIVILFFLHLGPGISAKFVKISNKGTTFRGSWSVYHLQFEGENIPNVKKFNKTMMSENPLGVSEDCNIMNLLNKDNGNWFVRLGRKLSKKSNCF